MQCRQNFHVFCAPTLIFLSFEWHFLMLIINVSDPSYLPWTIKRTKNMFALMWQLFFGVSHQTPWSIWSVEWTYHLCGVHMHRWYILWDFMSTHATTHSPPFFSHAMFYFSPPKLTWLYMQRKWLEGMTWPSCVSWHVGVERQHVSNNIYKNAPVHTNISMSWKTRSHVSRNIELNLEYRMR